MSNKNKLLQKAIYFFNPDVKLNKLCNQYRDLIIETVTPLLVRQKYLYVCRTCKSIARNEPPGKIMCNLS